MKTTLHTYTIDIKSKGGYEEWNTLCCRLAATNGRPMRVLADPERDRLEPGEVELELEHLFSNQWNTATNRVFDWYEGVYPNASLKHGHYLDITDEMREIRRNTNVCGYCGHQEAAAKGLVFCDRCLDSPYLKEPDLFLTRMMSVETWPADRAPLTEAELAHLMSEYVRRQTTGADSRNAQKLAKHRRDIEKKFEKAVGDATAERDGMLWLMDRGFDIDNVIYYTHTQRFGFGWRSPVSDAVASKLLEVVSEFPFAYEIKGVSRSWESYNS